MVELPDYTLIGPDGRIRLVDIFNEMEWYSSSESSFGADVDAGAVRTGAA
jgi:hypothetical protein